jgi:hypothetical protein
MDVNEWISYECSDEGTYIWYMQLRTFVTHLLVHMHQKEKITLEIAAKIIKTLMPQSNENKSCMRVDWTLLVIFYLVNSHNRG